MPLRWQQQPLHLHYCFSPFASLRQTIYPLSLLSVALRRCLSVARWRWGPSRSNELTCAIDRRILCWAEHQRSSPHSPSSRPSHLVLAFSAVTRAVQTVDKVSCVLVHGFEHLNALHFCTGMCICEFSICHTGVVAGVWFRVFRSYFSMRHLHLSFAFVICTCHLHWHMHLR